MGIGDLKFPTHPVNHSAFQGIDTPLKGYLLGFLLVDGCVHDPSHGSQSRITLRIKADDMKVCCWLQEIAGGHLHFIEGGYRILWEVNSDPIAADLAALGVTPREPYTAALVWDRIPVHLHGAVTIKFYTASSSSTSWCSRKVATLLPLHRLLVPDFTDRGEGLVASPPPHGREQGGRSLVEVCSARPRARGEYNGFSWAPPIGVVVVLPAACMRLRRVENWWASFFLH
jgi:hypothetical protein